MLPSAPPTMSASPHASRPWTAARSRRIQTISAALTTDQLVTLNGQVELNHQDADAVAKAYLQQHNYFG